MVIGVPFTVPEVTPVASVPPGKTIEMFVLVVMSHPSRAGTCAVIVYVAEADTSGLDGETLMN